MGKYISKKFCFFFILFILIFSCFQVSSSDISQNNFFKVEERNDRWCFVNPNEEAFYSTGIGSISANNGYSPVLGYSEYYNNIIKKYGNEENWANITHDRLVDWGFNSLGGSGKYIRNTGFYYTENLGLAFDDWISGEISDYFSDEWIDKVDERCSMKITNISNDTNLIGYFLDNEVHWGSDWRSLLDIFDTYMKLDSNSPGKIRLVEFLKDRYENNITKFNLAWRTTIDDFEEILYKKGLGMWPYTIEARNDHNDFLYVVAEQFFKICYQNIHKYDENHLILGCRFQSYTTPREVVKACKDYVDVVSVNHYPARLFIFPFWLIFKDIVGFTSPNFYLQEYHDLTNKPVLISEFYFRAKDSGLPNTKPSNIFMPVLRTQKQRALCSEILTRGFIEKKYSIGYHWFGYCDQPKTGRFDGENSNNGLVNIEDEPYELLVNTMKNVNNYAHNVVKNI